MYESQAVAILCNPREFHVKSATLRYSAFGHATYGFAQSLNTTGGVRVSSPHTSSAVPRKYHRFRLSYFREGKVPLLAHLRIPYEIPILSLRDINLTVAKGEFVALIGHSGCGKSTLLNLIAGLTTPTSGALLCANREIAGPGPDRAVVFQNHSLLPWLTCFENVYLGVERVFGAGGKNAGAPLVKQ